MQSTNSLKNKGLYLLKPCTRKLIGFLAHQDPRLKEQAASALESIGDPEAVGPLTEAILNEKQDNIFPQALAAIGDENSFNNLVKAFYDADKECRPNIALALGRFNDKKAIELLASGLNDLDANVRYACITSLGNLKDMSVVSNLLGCLGESNEWIFFNVVDALAKIGSHKATNPLVAFYLRERNERKRAAIVSALGRLGDLTSVSVLTKALRDPDDRVKANAIEAFAKFGLPSDKVFSLIQPFFKHESNRVKGNALVSAYKIGKKEEVASYVKQMATDSNKWVRATLAYILSVLDFDNSIDYLITLLKDDEEDVRKNAAKSFSIRAKEIHNSIVINMLNDSIPFVRLQAIQTLGKLRVFSASEHLIKLLETEHKAKLRASIISSLGHIGGNDAKVILKNALLDKDSRIRANAVEGLEEILGSESVNIIKPLLHDSDNRTKANAAKVLFNQGELDVVEELEKMLSSRDISLKISAAYSLKQLGIVLNNLVRYPENSFLAEKIDKIVVPEPIKIIRATLVENINSPVLDKKEGKTQNNDQEKALPQAVKSNFEIKEDLRNNYQNLLKLGKIKEAIEACEMFLSKFPYDIKALTFIGNLYFKQTRFEDAINIFNRILEIDSFSIQALSNLGTAYYRFGELDKAVECYKKALHLKPDLSVIRFNLGSIFLKNAKWQDAIRQYEEGFRYQQPNGRTLSSLALAYQKTGDLKKAAEIYRKVLVFDSHDSNAFYNLAVILNKEGKNNEAIQLLRRSLNAVEVDSLGYKNLKDMLERLSNQK